MDAEPKSERIILDREIVKAPSAKLQRPGKLQIPITKGTGMSGSGFGVQALACGAWDNLKVELRTWSIADWSLKFGASLELGDWCLEL
jgi:hypothetical protein